MKDVKETKDSFMKSGFFRSEINRKSPKTRMFETRTFTKSEELFNDLLSAFHERTNLEIRSKWNNRLGVTLRLIYQASDETFIIGYEPMFADENRPVNPTRSCNNYYSLGSDWEIENKHRVFKLDDYGDNAPVHVWIKSVLLAWESEVDFIDNAYHSETFINRSQFKILYSLISDCHDGVLDTWYMDVPGGALSKRTLEYRASEGRLVIVMSEPIDNPKDAKKIETKELDQYLLTSIEERTERKPGEFLASLDRGKLIPLVSKAILWWNKVSPNK